LRNINADESKDIAIIASQRRTFEQSGAFVGTEGRTWQDTVKYDELENSEQFWKVIIIDLARKW